MKLPDRQKIIGPLLLFLGGLLILVTGGTADEHAGKLQVTFFDVGQGDAIFIEAPSGAQVLIDGGRSATVLQLLSRELGFFDRELDLVIATHPDQDHIGGLIDVFERYSVRKVLRTENVNDTPTANTFDASVKNEGAEILYARAGQVLDLGIGEAGSTTLTVLFPDRAATNLESNTSSIVVQLSYGESDFLLTGDSPRSIEEYLVERYGNELESEVLKVGHHGSKTSSSDLFVGTVAPLYGVVSAGANNSYGHPHRDVLETLRSFAVAVKSTADSGSITFVSDGTKVELVE